MWEAIGTYLQTLGPTLGLVVIILAGIAYLATVVLKFKTSEKTIQAKIQTEIAQLYHGSLSDIEKLRTEVQALQLNIIHLSTEVGKFRLVLIEIKLVLKRLERKHPELNGDLKLALDAVENALNGVKCKDRK